MAVGLRIQEFLTYSISPTNHAATLNLGFHSGKNNLIFLLLYEVTLLGNWLQAFRQNVGSHFSKGQNSHQIFPIEEMGGVSGPNGSQ
jgi:hypothetical protein